VETPPETPTIEMDKELEEEYVNADTIPYDVFTYEIERYKSRNWEF